MFSAANIRNDGIVKLMLARRMSVLTLVPGLAQGMQNSMKRFKLSDEYGLPSDWVLGAMLWIVMIAWAIKHS